MMPNNGGSRAAPRTVLWLAIALAVGLAALLIIGIALLAKSNDAQSVSASKTSTSQDWIQTVCKRGSIQDGKGANILSGSTGTATCYDKRSQASVIIGSYESQFRFDNARANFSQQGTFATVADNEGKTWVFYSPNGTADFSGLTQFGFTIQGP